MFTPVHVSFWLATSIWQPFFGNRTHCTFWITDCGIQHCLFKSGSHRTELPVVFILLPFLSSCCLNLCWISSNYTYGFKCCAVFIHQKVTWWWKDKERWVGSWTQIWKLYLDIFIGEQSHKETNTSTRISNILCSLQGHVCLQYICVVSLYLKSTGKTHSPLAQWSQKSTAVKAPILSLSLEGQAPSGETMWKHVAVILKISIMGNAVREMCSGERFNWSIQMRLCKNWGVSKACSWDAAWRKSGHKVSVA